MDEDDKQLEPTSVDRLEEPLSQHELREIRRLMKDVDRYLFAINLIRRVSVGFAILVGVLYGGKDLIGKIWKALL